MATARGLSTISLNPMYRAQIERVSGMYHYRQLQRHLVARSVDSHAFSLNPLGPGKSLRSLIHQLA